MEAGAGAGATRTRVLLGEMGERAMSRMWEAGQTHLRGEVSLLAACPVTS